METKKLENLQTISIDLNKLDAHSLRQIIQATATGQSQKPEPVSNISLSPHLKIIDTNVMVDDNKSSSKCHYCWDKHDRYHVVTIPELKLDRIRLCFHCLRHIGEVVPYAPKNEVKRDSGFNKRLDSKHNGDLIYGAPVMAATRLLTSYNLVREVMFGNLYDEKIYDTLLMLQKPGKSLRRVS